MNKKYLSILIVLLTSALCSSQWVQTNGIHGGSVSKIFAVNGKVYAAANYGTVYLSYDGGLNYIIRSSGIKGVYVTSFTSLNNTVFASSSDSGIYKTTNDGVNWHKSNSGLKSLYVNSLITHEGLLCAAASGGFYTSSNSGVSWIEPDTTFNISISALSSANNFIYAAVTLSTVLQSGNNGMSWDTSMIDSDHYIALQSIESKGSEIYTAGYLSGLYRTTNSGLNWSYVYNAPAFMYSIKILDDKVLAATSGGLFHSTDKGLTWNVDSNGIIPYIDSRTLAVEGENIYVGIGSEYFPHCIYKSTDRGFNWIPSSSNIIATRINTLHKIDDRIYASAGYKGLFYSTDHGDNWINANADLDTYAYQEIKSVGNCQSNYLLLSHRNFRSTNSGQNWSVFGSSSNPHFYEFLTTNDTMLALKEYPWKSTDCGITWVASRNNFDPGNYGGELRYTGQHVYVIAGTSVSTSSLFRSSDFGNYWTRTLYTGSGFRLRHLAAIANHVILSYVSISDTGIMASTNFGESFNYVNNGLICKSVNTLFTDSNRVYSGTTNGVYYKNLDENLWHPYNNIEFNLDVNCFLTDSIYLYAGTIGGGVWRIPRNNVITGSGDNVVNVTDFSLSQNYPNPFNPSTTISFSVPAAGIAEIIIYDLLGNKVKTLINQKVSRGNYIKEFKAENLPSGIYFCSLIFNGEFKDSKKMVMIK